MISSDDLGMTFGFNEGIRQACKEGVLTSSCICPNGPAYRHALNHVLPDCPRLAVGVHVDLLQGAPLSRLDQVSRLIGRSGRFCHSYKTLWRLSADAEFRSQVRREWSTQVGRVIKDGVRIDHLNGHRHVHMIPRLFKVLCEVAKEFGVTWIRNVSEPFHLQSMMPHAGHPIAGSNILKHLLLNRFSVPNRRTIQQFGLNSTDDFVGILYTGRMTTDRMKAGLMRCRNGVAELLIHTAQVHDPRDHEYANPAFARYANSPWRKRELAAVCSNSFKVWLDAQGWKACNFAQANRSMPVSRGAQVDWPDASITPISTT